MSNETFAEILKDIHVLLEEHKEITSRCEKMIEVVDELLNKNKKAESSIDREKIYGPIDGNYFC